MSAAGGDLTRATGAMSLMVNRFQVALTLVALLLTLLVPLRAAAVQPDEMLSDPALEARARDISKELRCLVCRNESIDDSHADLAHDLRVLVRERLVAGDTDAEVKQFMVDRYGEFVLLKPSFSAANALLWLAGPLVFLVGLVIAILYLRRSRPEPSAQLSAEEKAALGRALDGR